MDDTTQGYADRSTGTSYPDGRALVNAYIERFSERVSAGAGREVRFSPLDQAGFSSVTRGSATVGINVFEEQGVLMFLCRVMRLPDEGREILYRKLLELNYLATSDGAFAVDKETETVCLRALRSLDNLDYQEFEDLLHTVATVADEWDDRLLAEFGEG